MIRTGKSWGELMVELGFDYSKVKCKYSALLNCGIDWWRISNAYENKYGKIEGRKNTYQSKKWLDQLSADVLLKEFFEL